MVVVRAPGVQSGAGLTNSVKGHGACKCGNRTGSVCLPMTSGYLGGSEVGSRGTVVWGIVHCAKKRRLYSKVIEDSMKSGRIF